VVAAPLAAYALAWSMKLAAGIMAFFFLRPILD